MMFPRFYQFLGALASILLCACSNDVFATSSPDNGDAGPGDANTSDGKVGIPDPDASDPSDTSTDTNTADSADAANACLAINGPALVTPWYNGGKGGMRIKALKNTTLTGFTFSNGDKADTVQLTDVAGNPLHSLSTPASTPLYKATVSWPLMAGTSYDLIDVNANNGIAAGYNSYPQSNTSIEIDGRVDDSLTLQTDIWFAFIDLRTDCP